MNRKALVDIYLPAASKSFDVYIPLDIPLSMVMPLISSALSDLTDGKYQAGPDAILCDAYTGEIFDVNIEVHELGINNGSKLMLI